MKPNIIALSISLIMFSCWNVRISYKVFDGNIKKYALGIARLLIFWVTIRIIKMFIRINFLWYLFYVALIFMPTLYYLCSRYLINKDKKLNKYIVYSISTFLLILVLTNDIHNLVFKFDYKDYRNYIGYFIILVWIMYLLVCSTINMLKKNKHEKSIRVILPFVPIVIGLIYTILYVLEIPAFIREINMTVVIGWLFVIGIEIVFSMELIPNNLQYEKFFKNSYLPISILSKKGEIVYQTSNFYKVPNIIIEDIKNNKVKESYKNPNNENQVFEIGVFKEGYSVIKKDFSNIENLKKELEEKNEKLKAQEKSLITQKNLEDKLYEMKLNSEILESLENRIKEKRERIENIINNMDKPNREELEEARYLISYCKRMSNLIVSNYNNEIYNKEKIKIIFDELLEDSKPNGIYGAINIDNNIKVESTAVIEIYEIMFSIFENIEDTGVLINLEKNKMKIVLDKKCKTLKNVILSSTSEEKIKEILEKEVEDGKEIFIELST